MRVIYRKEDSGKNEELTIEEVRAMQEYKDLSDKEIRNVIESIRAFTEIIYALFLKKEQEQNLESETKIISININQQSKKAA